MLFDQFQKIAKPGARATAEKRQKHYQQETLRQLNRNQLLHRPAIFAPDPIGVGSSALARNQMRTGGQPVVLCPVLDSRYITHDDESLVYTVDKSDFIPLAGKTNSVLFDPLHFYFIDKGGQLVNKMAATLPGGYHDEVARRMEKDRVFGKQVAQAIGLNVLPYALVTKKDRTPAQLAQRIAHIPGKLVVLKYNTQHFIGIMDRESAIAQLPKMLKHGDVCVEQRVSSDREINYCFMVGPDVVQPLCALLETNKLMTNNTGGKTGTAWSVHTSEIEHHRWGV